MAAIIHPEEAGDGSRSGPTLVIYPSTVPEPVATIGDHPLYVPPDVKLSWHARLFRWVINCLLKYLASGEIEL